LANNQINVIDKTGFSSITHLETLDLSHNHLDEKSIAKQAFYHLSHLQNLKFFFVQIKRIIARLACLSGLFTVRTVQTAWVTDLIERNAFAASDYTAGVV
jgi:Leucine-rich repeat (LRR) protein